MNKKLNIAVFDLTDCEGCELEFLNTREKILNQIKTIEFSNWRLLQETKQEEFKKQKFDVTFIEGTPLTNNEIKLLKRIREKSQILIALGTCACLGGVQGILNSQQREEAIKKIYGEKYKTAIKAAQPISAYVQVDFLLDGCPVNPNEIEKTIAQILAGKKLEPKDYPVCLACKARENTCLLLENKPCMGPVTAGGCAAICPSYGFPCFGCFGPIKDANVVALRNRFKDFMPDKEAQKWVATVWKNTEEYKKFINTKSSNKSE